MKLLSKTRRNETYLPGIVLSPELIIQAQISASIQGADCIVVAVPSEAFRKVTHEIAGYSGTIISVTKGIEHNTGLTMCGIVRENVPKARVAALSGPTFATEVARGMPTAIVAASADISTASQAQQLFNGPTFRVYTSTDLLGVELGGAVKNVIAIAAGVGDGLGFGDNSKAALVTRAIAEVRRLGVACGAQAETFTGLSGLGDLMVTCFSQLSRNRAFGERVGHGEKAEAVLSTLPAVVEGYPTARSAYQVARKFRVSTPVLDEVYAMLYENKDVGEAVRALMSRDVKAED
jgi:glycerol-3-phosphate dehydrogenase (NAD(P)+)